MDFSTENDTLSRISKALYGDALTLAVMDPKDISLLKKNARILKKDVFQQLTANIGRDKRLSSVPLCHRLSDGRVEVLSGNHRVQASVEAGIERILVMIIEEDLTRSQAVAIQLSHNALVGEDDPALLAELWAEIEDIAAKTYAGLSSDVVEKLDKIDLTSFTTPQVSTRTMTFAFVDSEAERLNAVLDELDGLPAKEIWLADVRQFDRFFDLLEATKKTFDVRNASLAMLKLMDSFMGVTKEAMPKEAEMFSQRHVPYIEVDVLKDFDQVLRNVLSGVTCLFIEGYAACIAIDTRTYPARSVEEPDKDKSLRGSRDGFVETIVFNTALMRRRIRDEHLIMEMTEAGQTSRTDIAICYMSDRVDKELLANVKSRIESLHIDDLKMNQQTLAEAMFKRKWFNPFPKFKFTERPDTAVACLLEGKVIILVDNSPSAMILPTSILDMIEEANDYYFPTVTGMYLKVSRAIITILTVFMTPVYLLFMMNPSWIPSMFEFTAVRDVINVPLVLQFLILELCIDGLRLAALNTPSMLSTPLSVIAGLVLGEFAVQSGWFNSEVMLYMAFVAVANYTQPNFEMGYALKFMRLMLLVLTALFDWVGFLVGCLLILCFLACNKTLSGRNYLNIKLN